MKTQYNREIRQMKKDARKLAFRMSQSAPALGAMTGIAIGLSVAKPDLLAVAFPTAIGGITGSWLKIKYAQKHHLKK